MRDAVLGHLSRLFDLNLEMADWLPERAFDRGLPVPSNTIGEQFWCIIGARESYAAAITRGAWAGFSCSLTSAGTRDKDGVVEHLRSSAAAFGEAAGRVAWDAGRDDLLLELLEHEAQHQGQLIRYVYSLGDGFPAGWVERWSLGG